jgi:hypothetical protein
MVVQPMGLRDTPGFVPAVLLLFWLPNSPEISDVTKGCAGISGTGTGE